VHVEHDQTGSSTSSDDCNTGCVPFFVFGVDCSGLFALTDLADDDKLAADLSSPPRGEGEGNVLLDIDIGFWAKVTALDLRTLDELDDEEGKIDDMVERLIWIGFVGSKSSSSSDSIGTVFREDISRHFCYCWLSFTFVLSRALRSNQRVLDRLIVWTDKPADQLIHVSMQAQWTEGTRLSVIAAD
jgi:hypothetical protein